MTVLPAGAISITDAAIVLAAETVAPRLGLMPEALHAEMQCLVETGGDEDEGRTWVTVRYHARSFTLEIEPDGKERAMTWSAVASVMGVGQVKVTLTFDPPWDKNRMSDDAKDHAQYVLTAHLGRFRIRAEARQ